MAKIPNKLFDKMVYHSLSIELMDDTVLHYDIDEYEKADLEKYLDHRTDSTEEYQGTVLMFVTKEHRAVFVKIDEIRNIIFCYEPEAHKIEKTFDYNFDIKLISNDIEDMPDAIIKCKGRKEPYVFSVLDYESNFLYLDDESFYNPMYLNNGLISLEDDDGEWNYFPMRNISCIDVRRELIYPDGIWNDMQLEKQGKSREN